MVYISSDGRVLQNRPWSFRRFADIFWGTINFVTQFFQTLLGFEGTAITGNNRRNGRGGGGPGGPGNGGPPRPPRRIGTMKEIQDCSMPGGG